MQWVSEEMEREEKQKKKVQLERTCSCEDSDLWVLNMFSDFIKDAQQFIPALRRQRQAHLCEFGASLVYIINSRTARDKQRDPVSKK
ncbi:hypothetical protein ACRRTK_005470 [Alexandromys fortis]